MKEEVRIESAAEFGSPFAFANASVAAEREHLVISITWDTFGSNCSAGERLAEDTEEEPDAVGAECSAADASNAFSISLNNHE